MPSYSYHIKIDLYPCEDPRLADRSGHHLFGGKEEARIWQPRTGGCDIFDNLPAHTVLHAEQDITVRKHELSAVDQPETLGNRYHSKGPVAGNTEEDNTSSIAVQDWRYGPIRIESYDPAAMASVENPMTLRRAGSGSQASTAKHPGEEPPHSAHAASLGPILGGPGQATKGQYSPLETKTTNAGWGVVHLYREHEQPTNPKSQGKSSRNEELNGSDGTILCIPSVPGFLTPNNFLEFVGPKWLNDVSHYRMVMTSQMNQYMVLMKFRDSRLAQAWRAEFNGRSFGSMGPEVCYVTFIKSITVDSPSAHHASVRSNESFGATSPGPSGSVKPVAPPTSDLTELPTCTVCLERMDDTASLMTILCQHIFHCNCLQTWRGSACPICRASNRVLTTVSASGVVSTIDLNNPSMQPFGDDVSNLCSQCDTPEDLWICLICGNVGCGRYKGGHARDHWKTTSHNFSLEIETQYIWDYVGDLWVHRVLRENGAGGKVVEFPSATPNRNSDEDEDLVPRAKLDNISLEYTHLLTSQLDSQRLYFEDMVNKAAAKAAKATAAAESAAAQAQDALTRLALLEEERTALRDTTVPSLERDAEREKKRGEKSTELARRLGASLQEEKKINEGLMQRLEHIGKDVEVINKKNVDLLGELADLKDQNHDLSMFISGQEKLRQMESEGQLDQGEVEGGDVGVVEKKKTARSGKGKKR